MKSSLIRSKSKKRLKLSQRNKRRFRSRSVSTSLQWSLPDNQEGITKENAQKRFLAKDVKVKSIEDILLIGIKTIENVVTEENYPLPVIRHVHFWPRDLPKRCLNL